MGVHKGFFALILLILVWLTGKFVLPFGFPFLLGTALALAAEPMVRLGTDRLKLRRGAAAGIGVTCTLGLILGVVVFLGGLLVREAGSLAQKLPAMAKESAGLLEDALVSLYKNEIIPSFKNGLCAAVLTQVSDVEDETNGLLTYDRKVLKVDPDRFNKLSQKIYAEFNKHYGKED